MRRSAHTRRALLTTLFFAAGCAGLSAPDPIIDRWRGDGADLVFNRYSDVRIIPDDDEDSGIIDYVFPRVSWRRNGSTYRLLYVYPRDLGVPAEERQAQIRGDELVVSTRERVLRYRRATHPG